MQPNFGLKLSSKQYTFIFKCHPFERFCPGSFSFAI
jgi:hypothetical protein